MELPDMAQFKQKFREDAAELLNDLEKNLLLLEKQPNDSALIEEVFRAMHTLKGSAGMYSFDEIGQLTHRLENVYDVIRNGRITLSNEILELTLKAVDFLHKALNTEIQSDLNDEYNDFYHRINALLSISDNEIFNGEKKEIENLSKQKHDKQTWFITIKPTSDLRKRGVKMHTIFDELNELGKNRVYNRMSTDPDGIGMFWEIILATDASMSDIEDVLIFVEDISVILPLSEHDLFEKETFTQKLVQLEQVEQIPVDELVDFVEKIENQEDKQEDKDVATIKIESSEITSIKVAAERLDEQMTLLSELVTAKSELQMLVEKGGHTDLMKTVEQISKISRRFRKNILKIRMIPISTLNLRFERLIRDLSNQLNKEVNFVTEGMQTELDKTIIDRLEKPLMHLIRNCLDHGIESPDIRKMRGKAAKGTIRVAARQAAANVVISITDDGEGINKEKIREKAIKKQLIEPHHVLTDDQVYELLFTPGFSTARSLTEVSGRGVGMDVVKKAISNLRGGIIIESEKGQGTTFTIKLPLSLSIIDTMLVKSGASYYSIPLTAISKCAEITTSDLQNTDNECVAIEDKLIPYITLNGQQQLTETEETTKYKTVIITVENQTAAIIVDEVIGEHQAVLKPLGDYFKHQHHISGASQLADGQIAIVLDPERLIKRYID